MASTATTSETIEEPAQNALFVKPYGQQAARVSRIIRYPMGHIVRRYAKDHDVPSDVAKEIEVELKRYFILTALNPSYDYGMAGSVDDLWHTFILFTKEYKSFCETHIGRFLHHYPDRIYDGAPGGTNIESNDTLEWYGAFLADYTALFGATPPAHIWPDVTGFPVKADQSYCRVCGTDPRPDPVPDPNPGGSWW